MVHEPEAGHRTRPERREEYQLAQVLDEQVVLAPAQKRARPPGDTRVVLDAIAAEAQEAHAAAGLFGRASGETRTKDRGLDAVVARQPRARLLEVDLHAAGQGMPEIALVQHEDAQWSRPLPRAAHSLPRACRAFNSQTIQRASSPMRLDILEVPTSRSMKMIGISWMRNPLHQAR